MAVNINPERGVKRAPRGTPTGPTPDAALSDQPYVIDGTGLRDNQRAIAMHLDDDYYVWEIMPGQFTADSGLPGALLDSSGANFSAVRMADAADQAIVATRRRRKLWVSGHFYFEFDYTSNTAGTANFSLDIRVRAAIKNAMLTTATDLLNVAGVAWPGPALAQGVTTYGVYTTTPLSPNHRLIGLWLKRNGTTDANNNNLRILQVTATFLPSRQEVDVR